MLLTHVGFTLCLGGIQGHCALSHSIIIIRVDWLQLQYFFDLVVMELRQCGWTACIEYVHIRRVAIVFEV